VKLAVAIAELQRSETQLAHHLRVVAARHHSDAGVFYLASDLALWSDSHVRTLRKHRARYGVAPANRRRHLAATAPLQRRLSQLLRRRPEPSLLLLADLRHIHRMAAGVSLDWGIARPRCPGRQRRRAAHHDQPLPPADVAADALGQRDAQRTLTANIDNLTGATSTAPATTRDTITHHDAASHPRRWRQAQAGVWPPSPPV